MLEEHQMSESQRKTTSPSKRVPGHFVKSMGMPCSPGKKGKKQKDPAETALRQLA